MKNHLNIFDTDNFLLTVMTLVPTKMTIIAKAMFTNCKIIVLKTLSVK